jgi:DNA primase
VEGFFDCLKLHQAAVPAVAALLGAGLYQPQQCTSLRHFRSPIQMLDGDAAGRCATVTIAAQLRPHIPVRVIHLPDQVQPDPLSREAIRAPLNVHRGAPGPIY